MVEIKKVVEPQVEHWRGGDEHRHSALAAAEGKKKRGTSV
jgi:hypothetical protein